MTEKTPLVRETISEILSRQVEALTAERDRLRALYGDMLNQFAYRTEKDGRPIVSTGGESDLEAAFDYFKLPDPCSLDEFHAALAEPRP